MTYRSNSCVPKKDEIEKIVAEEDNCGLKAVYVRQINLDWMLKDKQKFIGLAEGMIGQPCNFYAS